MVSPAIFLGSFFPPSYCLKCLKRFIKYSWKNLLLLSHVQPEHFNHVSMCCANLINLYLKNRAATTRVFRSGPTAAIPSSWDTAIDEFLRLITGCLVPAPVEMLPALAGIALSHIRRNYAVLDLAEKFFQPDSLVTFTNSS